MLFDDREARTLAALDALHIRYTLLHHDAAYTMEACHGIVQEEGVAFCKNLVLCNRQQTSFYLLSLREDHAFRTKDVSHQLGVSRLSFAPDSYLPELLGVLPGSVSPFGLLFDAQSRVRFLLDSALRDVKRVAFHPCVNTATVVLQMQDFLSIYLPSIGREPVWVCIGTEEEECALT